MWITLEDMTRLRKLDTFGGRLRMAREDAGLNQEQLTALLAERYGVAIGRSYISELERSWEANKMPMADVLAAIASALSAIPDTPAAALDGLHSQIAEHEAAVKRRQASITQAQTLAVDGLLTPAELRSQLDRLSAAIAAEQAAIEHLRGQIAAAQALGTRRERLQQIIAAGYEMLTTDDTAAANTWWREHARVWCDHNRIIEIRLG